VNASPIEYPNLLSSVKYIPKKQLKATKVAKNRMIRIQLRGQVIEKRSSLKSLNLSTSVGDRCSKASGRQCDVVLKLSNSEVAVELLRSGARLLRFYVSKSRIAKHMREEVLTPRSAIAARVDGQ